MDLLDQVEELFDQLAQVDPFAYSDKVSLEQMQKVRSQFECVLAKALAAFDDSGEWASEGAKDAEAWVSTRCHLRRAEVRGQIRRGHALDTLPVCAEAFAKGEIGTAQVDALARAAAVVGPGVMARDEVLLVDVAKGMKFGAFNAALTYWTQYINPPGTEAAELARHSQRSATVSSSADGMVHLRADLPAISGTIVSDELRRLSDQLFDADWAEAKAELGRDPKVSELGRTHAQPSRRPGRNGHPLPNRSGRRSPARAPLQRGGRLPEPLGADLPAGERPRPAPGGTVALDA